jgi:hypothetical protein
MVVAFVSEERERARAREVARAEEGQGEEKGFCFGSGALVDLLRPMSVRDLGVRVAADVFCVRFGVCGEERRGRREEEEEGSSSCSLSTIQQRSARQKGPSFANTHTHTHSRLDTL